MKRGLKIVVVGILALAIVISVGTWAYIHIFSKKAPAALSLSTTDTTIADAGPTITNVNGAYKVAGDSTVGYRVNEVLFGQSATAVGRTNSVTGNMTIAANQVTASAFSVDMTTVTSDREQRDNQFQGRIMDTADFPTATFTLTSPVALSANVAVNSTISESATGKLMLHGITKAVTFRVSAKRESNVIAVNGSIPIAFSDYNIDNPSFGPATVGNSGTLEFLIDFTKS